MTPADRRKKPDPKPEDEGFKFELGFDVPGGMDAIDLPPPDMAGSAPPPKRLAAGHIEAFDDAPADDAPAGDGGGTPEVGPDEESAAPRRKAVRNRDRVNIDDVLELLGIPKDKTVVEGNHLRVFCPIHRDQVRRSIVIDLETQQYKCQFKGCPGHAGGDIFHFVGLALQISPAEARNRLLFSSREMRVAQHGLVEQAQEYIGAGLYHQALPLLKEAVERAPGDEVTRCRLAALQLEMGDRENGVANYLRAAEDYGVEGELDKTYQIYKLLVLIDPKDLALHEQMAYIATRLGDMADAVARLKWLVDQFIESEQYEEAVQRADRLLEISPGSVEFVLLKADLYAAQGLVQKATELLAFEIQGKVKQGSLNDALILADKGVQLAPGNPLLLHLRNEVAEELTRQGTDPERLSQELRILREKEAESGDDDQGFRQWIADLEADIKPFEAAEAKYKETGEIHKVDERVMYCKESLKGFSSEQMSKMYQHLRQMYSDMKASYDAGEVSEFEKQVIRDFYKSFCIAFKYYNKDVTGDSMLTRF